MSTPSDSTVKGKFDEVVGKVKQGLGDTFNDQSLANKGAAQEVKGHGEQAWGSVKEAASDQRDLHATATETDAHNTRESITEGAAHLKDKFVAGVEAFRKK
jgi:uncharacterized protein YjbJ (UPF0337 family)